MTAPVWTKDEHILEFRTVIEGVECVVRPTKVNRLTKWSCSIHRERNREDVEVTTHETHWCAQSHAVGAVR